MSSERILEWTEDLASGDLGIDSHIKEFLRNANEFFDGRHSDYRSENLDKILGFLTDYSRKHFPAQEDMMKRTRYPSTDDHLAEHKSFIKSISKLYKQLLIQKKPRVPGDDEYDERGIDGVITDTYDFIINWYDGHMLITDKRLADYNKYEYRES